MVWSQAQIGTSLMENDEILISISRAESTEENEKIKTERHDALILIATYAQITATKPSARPEARSTTTAHCAIVVVLFLFCGLYKGKGEWKPRIRIKAKRAKVHRKSPSLLVGCWGCHRGCLWVHCLLRACALSSQHVAGGSFGCCGVAVGACVFFFLFTFR